VLKHLNKAAKADKCSLSAWVLKQCSKGLIHSGAVNPVAMAEKVTNQAYNETKDHLISGWKQKAKPGELFKE
jgi:hypothetical protein